MRRRGGSNYPHVSNSFIGGAPEADWNKYAQLLTQRALIARAAAGKHDKTAVFDEGGRVYEVCFACHEQFVIAVDAKANGPAKADPLPKIPGAK